MLLSPNQSMANRPVQLFLPTPSTRGGRRPGAGRKRMPGRRASVPHRQRPPHIAAHPVHVTLRSVEAVRCLRASRVFPLVRRALGRSGRIWGDRYHARALTTPRAVRHAIVYVLMNFRKHLNDVTGIDPCSSAAWFAGWRVPPVAIGIGPPPVAAARTWLARVGWQRHGLIRLDERPK